MLDYFFNHKEFGLCCTPKLLTDSGAVSYKTFESASSRSSYSWQIIPHPEHGKKKLIVYAKLQAKYRHKVETFIGGNPTDYVSQQPIRHMVEFDHKAEVFYRKVFLELKEKELNEHATSLAWAAGWLNVLIYWQDNKRLLKTKYSLTIEKLLVVATTIFKTDKIALPKNMRRLQNKILEYKQRSYEALIHKGYNNKNAVKIGKTENGFDQDIYETQVAFIRNGASKHQNFNAMQITTATNDVFKNNGWQTISRSTITKVIKENEHLTIPGARGKRVYDDKISMHVSRSRPKFPLYYLTLDGWTVELLYQEKNTYTNRLVVVVVLDAMNNYPLGYAIGDRESADLIRQANMNAATHIKDLFGSYYQPRQLQSDHYGLKQLTPYYQAMSHHFIPAAVGNAKAKIIEPYFKQLNHNYCQYAPNWSGHNIDSSKHNQPNREYLNKTKTSFPDKNGVTKQIELIMQAERRKKLQEYLQRWEAAPESEKLLMSKIDLLMVLGKLTGYTNRITGEGLTATIEGRRMTYDSFDPKFRALQHLDWTVTYDPNDLSEVLATSSNDDRFLLLQKRTVPMDVDSMQPEDHQYLSEVRKFNKERYNEIMETSKNDALKVDEIISNMPLNINDQDETTLKVMFTTRGKQKEQLQDAKGLKKIERQQQKIDSVNAEAKLLDFEKRRHEFLMTQVDLTKYLNND